MNNIFAWEYFFHRSQVSCYSVPGGKSVVWTTFFMWKIEKYSKFWNNCNRVSRIQLSPTEWLKSNCRIRRWIWLYWTISHRQFDTMYQMHPTRMAYAANLVIFVFQLGRITICIFLNQTSLNIEYIFFLFIIETKMYAHCITYAVTQE